MAIEFKNSSREILENKAVDGGLADASHWITLPKGSTSDLADQKRREGAVAYDVDQSAIVVDDGSGFQPVGGGGGPIPPNSVGAAAIRLENDAYLRGRNLADDGDIEILKVNTSDQIELGSLNSNGIILANLLNMNNNGIGNLADPSSAQDAVTKAYVDRIAPIAVRAMAIGNKNVNAPGTNFDGITVSSGNLVLLTQQSTPAQNGVYVFGLNGGTPMSRYSLLNTSDEFTVGRQVLVLQGNTVADTMWVLQATVPTVGTSAVTFEQLQGGASSTLNNLSSPTAINQDLLPNADNARNLGSAATSWNGVYSNAIIDSTGNVAVQVTNRELVALTGETQFEWSTAEVLNLTGQLTPTLNDEWNIGSPSNQFSNLYLGGSAFASGVIGNASLSLSAGGDIEVDPISIGSANILLSDGGATIGTFLIKSNNTNMSSASINLATGDAELGSGQISIFTGDAITGSNSGIISLAPGGADTPDLVGEIELNAFRIRLNQGVIRITNLSADPTDLTTYEPGDMYYNDTTNKMKFFNGTTWETITSV